MSLKMVSIESSGTVSYSHSIVQCNRFDRIHERDGTRETPHDDIGRVYAWHRAATTDPHPTTDYSVAPAGE